MDFAQTEAEFTRLKAQVESGDLAEAEFKAKLEELILEDEQGRWWMIGYQTGKWYVHEGPGWALAVPQPTVERRPQAGTPQKDGRPDPAASQQHLGEGHSLGRKVKARSGSWERFLNVFAIIGCVIGAVIGAEMERVVWQFGAPSSFVYIPAFAVIGAMIGAGLRLVIRLVIRRINK